MKQLLPEFREFKFLATLVLVFKKKGSEHKRKYDNFFHTQKQKQLSMKATVIICLNQSILNLYQKSLGKSLGWNIDSVIDHTISISK